MGRSVSVAVVGAGFAGIGAAVALKREGVDDIVILERGERIGGVWRANTYPGLACDVPSLLYSLSFAPNPRWTRRFSPGDEIRGYLEGVARRFDVYRHIRFGASVQRAAWDDDAGRWHISLGDGEEIEAEVLLTAVGQLQRAQIPDVPGLDRFTGPMFHSAHWDHDVDLEGKRVAVLGTGASAIQFVPAIAESVKSLIVFQRSAPWTLSKSDREYPERVRRLHERLPFIPRLWRRGWWAWMESIVPLFTRRPPRLARFITPAFTAMSTAQRAIQLRFNPGLLAKTKPSYPIGAKRVLITSEWYPTLRRPNVDLETAPVTEVVEDAVISGAGRRHEADVIIFGTGFTATDFLAPMEVVGRERTLVEEWVGGAEAYLGMTVPGFPNLFLLYGPNTNHGTGSMLEMLEMQARYIAEAVAMLAGGAADRLEVRRDVNDAFQAELRERLADTVWATTASWYVTADGRVTNNWPGSQSEYRRRTRAVDLGDFVTAAYVRGATRS